MSRALIVLDTESQRRRAAEWCWAAKNGSRVEFKGPKRTLDQNSLMWALLTDVAVHMRKASGLEYSTEEWKHVFLHGWGREVRFLPALDGKGVVPIPQSSSDLSKEEMTDFIEYILKEGAERGVKFHEPSEATPQAEDEGSGEDSPSPPAADPSAQAAEPEAERPEVGQGGATDSASGVDEREMVNSGKPMNTDFLKAEMVKKVLDMAGDLALTPDQRLENLKALEPVWANQIVGHPGLVRQVFDTAAKVIRGELPKAKAQQFMEAL